MDFRYSFSQRKLVVTLVTRHGQFRQGQELARALHRRFSFISGVVQNINEERGNVIWGGTLLLKEAGYKGEPITITGRQGEDMETEGATLQFQLKQIGMNIILRVVDYGAYVAKQRAGDFALRFSGGSYDPDPSPTYGPDFVCPLNLKKRAANTTGYCDKEMEPKGLRFSSSLNRLG